VLAEGVGGSIDGFRRNDQAAQRLGMTQTSYVNPNGLPADGQITSARDLAILGARSFTTCRNMNISSTFLDPLRPQDHPEFQPADRTLIPAPMAFKTASSARRGTIWWRRPPATANG